MSNKKNRVVEERVAEFEVESDTVETVETIEKVKSTPKSSSCSCKESRDISCTIHGG